MQVCIHRGANEIGGSCIEVVSNGQKIILDLGLPLDADENGIKLLPNIPGILSGDDSPLAVIVSHPHTDHYGLLKHINPKIPVIMGAAAHRILTAAAPFMRDNFQISACETHLESGKTIDIGRFKITPYLVDHSSYDAYALLIEADGKRLFYSGDFRIHGRKAKSTEHLLANPPQNIDVLLMEGSTIGRTNNHLPSQSESKIEDMLADSFRKSNGLTLVQASAQNIDRIVSIFRACKKAGKTLVIDLYTAAILEATGNPNLPQSDWSGVSLFIPYKQGVQVDNNEWINSLSRKHKKNQISIKRLKKIAEKSVLLFRFIHAKDLEKNDLLSNATFIYSLWEGYWEEDSNSYLRDLLAKYNIPKVSIHTSGHAGISDLKRFAEAIMPQRIVPIHTFEPDKYKDLFENVELHADGEYWEV